MGWFRSEHAVVVADSVAGHAESRRPRPDQLSYPARGGKNTYRLGYFMRLAAALPGDKWARI